MRMSDWSSDVCSSDLFNTRGKIKWEPSSSTRVTLVGDYAYLDTSVGLALRPLQGLKPALAGFFTGGKYDVDLDTDVGITSSSGGVSQIGRAHVGTQVTNVHVVCRLLLAKNKQQKL